MPLEEVYEASHVKRNRATNAEMEERAEFLIDYAEAHGPVTVRQLYYQAEVHGLPGIDKTEGSYNKVQRQVLNLRREGRLAYRDISDATRWMRKPRSYDSVEDAIEHCGRLYRRSLWTDAEDYVEIWCEKDALAGVVYPVTSRFDVPLMVSRGFASETFCYSAIEARDGDDRDYYVYYLGDFDRAGHDAANSLEEKLTRLPMMRAFLAVTVEQVSAWRLPTREPKRKSPADKNWPHNFACELDAISPDRIRRLVENSIDPHVDHEQLAVLKVAEKSERELLKALGRRSA